jgi:hypothetical protein
MRNKLPWYFFVGRASSGAKDCGREKARGQAPEG